MIQDATGVDATVKDCVQIFSWLVGSIGGVVAATIALYQMRQGRRQRAEELRWKRASTALELMAQIHRNPYSAAAIHMLDWWGAPSIELLDGERVVMTSTAGIERTLSLRRADVATREEQFIWDAFDWFFYFIDRIGHLESIQLIEPGDVTPVFTPYLERTREKRQLFMPLITGQGYTRLARMLQEPAAMADGA